MEAVQFYGANPPQRPRRILAAATVPRPTTTTAPHDATLSPPQPLTVCSMPPAQHAQPVDNIHRHVYHPPPYVSFNPEPPPSPSHSLPTTALTRRRISFPLVVPSTQPEIVVRDESPLLPVATNIPLAPAASPTPADSRPSFPSLRVVGKSAGSGLPLIGAPLSFAATPIDAGRPAAACACAPDQQPTVGPTPIMRVFQHGDIYQLIVVTPTPNGPLLPFDETLAGRQNAAICPHAHRLRLPQLPDFGPLGHVQLHRYQEAVDRMLRYCRHFGLDECQLSRADVTQLLNFYLDVDNVGAVPPVPWDLGLSQAQTMPRPAVTPTPPNNFANIRCRPVVRTRERSTPEPAGQQQALTEMQQQQQAQQRRDLRLHRYNRSGGPLAQQHPQPVSGRRRTQANEHPQV